MEKPKLSVIVPIWNAESTLARCVDSVLVSDLYREGSVELVLINDGSTDGSAEICEFYAVQDGVTYIDARNGGVCVARNRGLAAATGRFVTFLDNDDHVAPDYHAKAIAPMAADDSIVLSIGGFTTVDAGGGRRVTVPSRETLSASEVPNRLVELMLHAVFNPVWNKIYRAEVIERHACTFEVGRRNAEDLLFNLGYLRASANGAVTLVDSAGLYWMRDSSSAAHVLEKRYTDLHELETSVVYRRSLTDHLMCLGVPEAEVDRYFCAKDNSWFYIMVRNILNPGTPYSSRDQLRQIGKVMEFEPARANILADRSRGRLAVLNRALYRTRSPRLVRAALRRL